jgi:hypothetical protein
LILWCFGALFISPIFDGFIDGQKSALIGDSFGGINSLFSGLAFGGIIVTLILQKQELKLQREELSLTRSELRKSADAQTEISNLQNITSDYDSMLPLVAHCKSQPFYAISAKTPGTE